MEKQNEFTYGIAYYPTTLADIKFSYSGKEIKSKMELYTLLVTLRAEVSGYFIGTIIKNEGHLVEIFEVVVEVGEDAKPEWWQHSLLRISKGVYDGMSEENRAKWLHDCQAKKFIGDI